MKEKRNLHLKVQELCDCYATTDPLKEMSALGQDKDKEEAALKWLALAALHGVNHNAEEITIGRDNKGQVKVVAKYRETELPSPGRRGGAEDHGRRPRNHPHRGRQGQDHSGPGDAQRQPRAEGRKSRSRADRKKSRSSFPNKPQRG
ncbi:MAG: hypothetical protein MZV70_55485 [Desulfobacterales bacterium]|nr:hypothetical protein [Desulfobacterales bacterium]